MMKKWLIFLFGLIVGIGLTLTAVYTINSENDTVNIEDDTLIEELEDSIELDNTPSNIYVETPGEIINEKSFKVFQVRNLQSALAYGKDEYGYYNGTLYLFEHSLEEIITKSVTPLYDDQIIKVPKGKVVRLVGTYNYVTRNGNYKTVPQVRIFDN